MEPRPVLRSPRQRRLAAVGGAEQVDADDPLPVRRVGLRERRVHRTPATFTRVWSRRGAPRSPSTTRAASASRWTSPTSGSSEAARHRGADGLGRSRDGFPVRVEQGHRRALLREEPPGRLPDAATAAGDERDAAGHAPGHRAVQTSVSWSPARTSTRARAPSTQLLARGQHHGVGSAPGTSAGCRRGRACRARGARGRYRHQAPAHLDDRGVAAAEALLAAVDDVALALLHRLVLHPEAGMRSTSGCGGPPSP